MKIVAKKPELCNGCGICEETCAQAWFKEKNKEKSAIRIMESSNGGFNIVVCDHCGECIDVCPVEAIKTAKSGVVTIKDSDCVECYSCVGFCPKGAMFKHPEEPVPFKCTSCGKCVKECPTGAIYMEEV